MEPWTGILRNDSSGSILRNPPLGKPEIEKKNTTRTMPHPPPWIVERNGGDFETPTVHGHTFFVDILDDVLPTCWLSKSPGVRRVRRCEEMVGHQFGVPSRSLECVKTCFHAAQHRFQECRKAALQALQTHRLGRRALKFWHRDAQRLSQNLHETASKRSAEIH